MNVSVLQNRGGRVLVCFRVLLATAAWRCRTKPRSKTKWVLSSSWCTYCRLHSRGYYINVIYQCSRNRGGRHQRVLKSCMSSSSTTTAKPTLQSILVHVDPPYSHLDWCSLFSLGATWKWGTSWLTMCRSAIISKSYVVPSESSCCRSPHALEGVTTLPFWIVCFLTFLSGGYGRLCYQGEAPLCYPDKGSKGWLHFEAPNKRSTFNKFFSKIWVHQVVPWFRVLFCRRWSWETIEWLSTESLTVLCMRRYLSSDAKKLINRNGERLIV